MAHVRGRIGVSVCAAMVASLAPISARPVGESLLSIGGRRQPTLIALRVGRRVKPPRAAATPPSRTSRSVPATRPPVARSRDVGISVVLPDGHDLWLFGDTGIFRRTGATSDGNRVHRRQHRTRGVVHAGIVPHGGDYPAGVPTRFIPAPTNVYLPHGGGQPCTYTDTTYPARWPTGAAVVPGHRSEVLVSYVEVCVTRTTSDAVVHERTEGWGYLLYNWRTHRIDHGPVDVFRPQHNAAPLANSRMLGSPYFNGNRLTSSRRGATRCGSRAAGGHVWSVSVPDRLQSIADRASYRPHELSTDGSGTWRPVSISVGKYAGEFPSRRNDVGRRDLPDLLGFDACRAVASQRVGEAAGLPASTQRVLLRAGRASRAEHRDAPLRVVLETGPQSGWTPRRDLDSDLMSTRSTAS